ncbi:alpha/beta hydrolase [Anaeromicrobium sediminis]|uniref:Alpha/beta hydrolase n=1 Tax=Anaeromicrobium sediminis TaxID=1478221 RepID=A0A267MI86_9FIRM|nr:alpha/beta hydrolase [Anaeromicrobium sediminis]PAB59291.1 alpha/beta hydrolase [Anaeromicrobium sediminis]
MIGKFIANMVTVPGDSPVFDSPDNYNLKYEDVTFTAEDGVELSGWIINPGKNKVILQQHFASQCSRAGYTPKGKSGVKLWDEDITFLRQAKHFANQGYSILMYDFRNHGKSGKAELPYVTGGVEEARDVIAAVEFISNHPDYKDASIGLFSICMGTNATSLAFGIKDGLENYKNIKAYVSVQPLNYGDFLEGMGMPKFLVNRANKANLNRGGKEFYATPYENLKKVHVPVMVFQNSNDPWTNMNSVKKYYETIPTEKKMVWADLEKKRAAAYDYVGSKPQEFVDFFNKYM